MFVHLLFQWQDFDCGCSSVSIRAGEQVLERNKYLCGQTSRLTSHVKKDYTVGWVTGACLSL